MTREFVDLDEGSVVEQSLHPLPGGQLAPGVLLLDRPLRPGVHGLVESPLQVGQLADRAAHVDVCWWRLELLGG